jgi:peptidyl-prolyl cis-trans isomerase SurA
MLRTLGAVILALTLLTAPAFAATVKITVNGQPITDLQIAQRQALHKLERSATSASDELINEAIEIGEAKRLGFTVAETDVDTAVLQLARNLKLSSSNLEKVLTSNGVGIATLRDRLRATIAWNKVMGTAVSARVQISEADIDQQARKKLTSANSYDYILKEIIFLGTGRGGQAAKYRGSYKGCDGAVQQSLAYTDAAVREVGRRHATQMPADVAAELATLKVGGITKARTVEGGVSMLLICDKEVSDDTTFIAQDLRQDAGNGALKSEGDKYLNELKAKAQIVKS